MSETPQSDDPCACDGVLEDIDSFLDHELTDERSAAIREHLATCVTCQSEYDVEQEVKSLVARCCGGQHAPPQVHARVRARLRVLRISWSSRDVTSD